MNEQSRDKKRSSSSLSYRAAQNVSYRQVNDTEQRTNSGSKNNASADTSYDQSPDGKRRERSTQNRRPASSHRRKKKKRGCLGSVIRLFIILILILLVIGFLYLRNTFAKIEKYDLDMSSISINDADENIGDYQNIALFGVDNQDNQIYDTGSRTDCIIIASINKSTKEVKLMSIYRDTYVSIDGEYDKINAAYSYGGPEQALNTINRNLDLNITDFATVSFKALADAVDILGGVELTIKSETELENLNAYIKNMNNINGGDSPTFDAVGTYTFDGNQAVAYSRIRYMEGGDHERANHQRLVLAGIVSQIKKQPWKLNELVTTVVPQCKTSLSSSDMMQMSLSLLRYSIADSQAYPFNSVDEKYGGIYYGFPITAYSNTIEAHEYLFGTTDYEPTEELSQISAKIEYVTDLLGY
ncbi:MAG: LCP family protein [Clostridiales bacterium]|nr:LCP family protein [Clostridiales bacterium]